MKVERSLRKFRPVTITLETRKELDQFYLFLAQTSISRSSSHISWQIQDDLFNMGLRMTDCAARLDRDKSQEEGA